MSSVAVTVVARQARKAKASKCRSVLTAASMMAASSLNAGRRDGRRRLLQDAAVPAPTCFPQSQFVKIRDDYLLNKTATFVMPLVATTMSGTISPFSFPSANPEETVPMEKPLAG